MHYRSPAARPVSQVPWSVLTLLMLFPLGAATGVVDFDRLILAASARYGANGVNAVREWQALIDSASNTSTVDKLEAANEFFNSRLQWRSDEEIYGLDDYWATPLEVLGRGAADCEDFSIAKYITLVALGLPTESLRLIYVTAKLANGVTQAHMVLAWYDDPTAPPLILDNVNSRLLRADQRRDLVPIFSFNASDLWLGGNDTVTGASPTARLSRWRDVFVRMRSEGLTGPW
ncbi:MAG: transglutaminase-like cysteine peptidase [Pseudomonadota bacterium]